MIWLGQVVALLVLAWFFAWIWRQQPPLRFCRRCGARFHSVPKFLDHVITDCQR